ncbi:hypothetical protein GX48_00072 [Paracoccidioides brasiliensis]|nr:hypothetical protein GX48_00072 [Paracoccidioides brasiliensis]
MTSNGVADSNPTSSPRISYFDGEIPPILSPLDAFALQGRLLAKQLDDSNKGDKRMSRLPPASVASSLSQPRPGYFRIPSASESTNTVPVSPGAWRHGPNGEVEEASFRPKSQHPLLGRISVQDLASYPDSSDGNHKPSEDAPVVPAMPPSVFGLPRAESPDEASLFHLDAEDESRNQRKPSNTAVGVSAATHGEPNGSPQLKRNASNTLAPPASSSLRHSGSPGMPQHESSDDDYFTSSTMGSTFSKPRKLSSSSAMSTPHSPMSHFTRPGPRSPSPGSENSTTPNPLPRPSFNFSRPLSRSSTSVSISSPSLHSPEQREESQPRAMNRDNRPSPITLPKSPDSTEDESLGSSNPTTYIYAKYSLPRGRSVSRNSLGLSGLQTPHIEWNEPLFESSSPPSASGKETFEQAPLSPLATYTHPPSSPSPLKQETPLKPATPPEPELPSKPLRVPKTRSPPRKSPGKLVKRTDWTPPKRHKSFDHVARETVPPAPSNSHSKLPTSTPKSDEQGEAKSTSTESNTTLRPDTSRDGVPPPTTALSAEDHVTKGIQCHENGSLNESTYHLRIAAMQNHPTGMLLYALACRHGWGMRPNPREGVQWLRKAVDCAALERSNSGAEPCGRNIEEKTRRAQFALSIYELGVSHLNGWGIEQDKPLALRCFEIAGRWGDVDALAEAGFCYVEGVGCKKDLKKAAKYYRMAESKGMSMVGNSWIYKPKYMSDDDSLPPAPSLYSATGQEKKPHNKSRSRSIFGHKTSSAARSVHNDS